VCGGHFLILVGFCENFGMGSHFGRSSRKCLFFNVVSSKRYKAGAKIILRMVGIINLQRVLWVKNQHK